METVIAINARGGWEHWVQSWCLASTLQALVLVINILISSVVHLRISYSKGRPRIPEDPLLTVLPAPHPIPIPSALFPLSPDNPVVVVLTNRIVVHQFVSPRRTASVWGQRLGQIRFWITNMPASSSLNRFNEQASFCKFWRHQNPSLGGKKINHHRGKSCQERRVLGLVKVVYAITFCISDCKHCFASQLNLDSHEELVIQASYQNSGSKWLQKCSLIIYC